MIVFQLLEEGLLNIDTPFLELLSDTVTKKFLSNFLHHQGINCAPRITVKNLLNHSSGCADYFADDATFLKNILSNPHQKWNWKKIMEHYYASQLHKSILFIPAKGFHYSDTNYLLLALLIEGIMGCSFHEVLDSRIIKEVSLKDTFLEFYENKKGNNTIQYPYFGEQSLKDVNTSFDWGGGGLVSTATDLDLFLRALFSGKLFQNSETLNAMFEYNDHSLAKNSRIAYGLGIQKKEILGQTLYGHNSAYGGMAFYIVERDTSIIINLNQAHAPHKAELLLKKIIAQFTSKN